jgi:hypothetical protein
MKVFNHVFTLEMKLERDHYTRHGFHLNTKGKDYSTKLLRSVIKNIFNINIFNIDRVTPIIMNWKEIHKGSLSKNLGKTRVRAGVNPEAANKQVETSQHEVSSIRVSGKERKTPAIRLNDFLW